MSSLFPTGLATGDAFCNRVVERAHLIKSCQHGRHAVLLAPRRYGKTSLVNLVMAELKYAHCEMDFLLSASGESAKQKIVERVGELAFQLLPRTQKTKEKILNIFKKMRPEIVLSAAGQKIVLHVPDNTVAASETISEVLMNLDKFAVAAKKRVVVFMDEFQQVGQLDDHHTIEAGIRHAVERSKNVSYIFSGSNRHMLSQMFSDKSRPFYKLCDTMTLSRITEADYSLFIQKHAHSKWKKPLSQDVLDTIFSLSERHPYYVNLICNDMWLSNAYPTVEKIELFWKRYVEVEKSAFVSELSQLSNNQKLLVRALAQQSTAHPFHTDYLKLTGLSVASQKQSLSKLALKDIVFLNEAGMFCVLDPAMRAYICSVA